MNRRRTRLAPLEADAFLRWAWSQGDREKGTSPLTVDDLWFELAPGCPGLTVEDVRRQYVSLAARVRRNQRVGVDAWRGIR